MILKGSQDENEARAHIALWQGMIGHWNDEADSFRAAARGRRPAAAFLLDDADRTRQAVQQALELCDVLTDNLAPGHELRADLFRIAAALEALSESLAISIDQLAPRIAANQEIAGLKYLVSALRENAAAH